MLSAYLYDKHVVNKESQLDTLAQESEELAFAQKLENLENEIDKTYFEKKEDAEKLETLTLKTLRERHAHVKAATAKFQAQWFPDQKILAQYLEEETQLRKAIFKRIQQIKLLGKDDCEEGKCYQASVLYKQYQACLNELRQKVNEKEVVSVFGMINNYGASFFGSSIMLTLLGNPRPEKVKSTAPPNPKGGPSYDSFGKYHRP